MAQLARQASLEKAIAVLEAMGEGISDGESVDLVRIPQLYLQRFLMCWVCSGYFREAHTFKECQHTFCKWCLMRKFDEGHRKCPFPGCQRPWCGTRWDDQVAVDVQKQCIVDIVMENSGCNEPPVLPRTTIAACDMNNSSRKLASRSTDSATSEAVMQSKAKESSINVSALPSSSPPVGSGRAIRRSRAALSASTEAADAATGRAAKRPRPLSTASNEDNEVLTVTEPGGSPLQPEAVVIDQEMARLQRAIRRSEASAAPVSNIRKKKRSGTSARTCLSSLAAGETDSSVELKAVGAKVASTLAPKVTSAWSMLLSPLSVVAGMMFGSPTSAAANKIAAPRVAADPVPIAVAKAKRASTNAVSERKHL